MPQVPHFVSAPKFGEKCKRYRQTTSIRKKSLIGGSVTKDDDAYKVDTEL